MANRSVFPDKLDKFVELSDLPADKVTDAQRYTTLKSKSTLSSAEQTELANLVNSLRNYIITPETMNKFSDIMLNLEKFFRDNVQGYISSKQSTWDSYIKNFHYVGKWVSSTAYKFQNLVTYNGDLYLCLKDHQAATTVTPTNTTYWIKTSSKGEKGDVGLNATFKGNWNSKTAYAIGDAISVAGMVYICAVANTGKNPASDGTSWIPYQQIVTGTAVRPSALSPATHYIQYLK